MSCSVFCICSYLYIISEWGGQGCRGDRAYPTVGWSGVGL